MTGRVAGGLLACGLVALGIAAFLALGREGAPGSPAATFAASRVQVTIRVTGEGDRRVIEADFVPDAPDLHLYGPDLPAGGIDGAGRPTRVEVVGGGWAVPDGEGLRVDPTPYPTALPGFSAPFSILPAGAVTVRVPVRPSGGDRAIVRVAVTYMACSADGRCYAPVVGQELDVAIP